MNNVRLICLMLGMVGFWYGMPAAASGEDMGADAHAIEYAPGAGDHVSSDGEDAGHASDGGESGGGSVNPLAADPDLAIFTAIIFIVLLLVLRKFAWGPIRDALDARESGIAEQIAAAERQNEEARRLLADHQTKLAQASGEVRALLDEGRREAELQTQRIVSEAREAATAEKDRALRAIEVAKNEALSDLARQSVDTAVDLAGRIVGEKLSAADHNRLVHETLDRFPSQN